MNLDFRFTAAQHVEGEGEGEAPTEGEGEGDDGGEGDAEGTGEGSGDGNGPVGCAAPPPGLPRPHALPGDLLLLALLGAGLIAAGKPRRKA